MIDYLFWGTIILFGATLIFYIVFFSLIFYWREHRLTVIVVPLIFTFEFFIVAFLVFALAMLVLSYFPELLGLFGLS